MEKKFNHVSIIYHKEDNDGVFSAAIASRALKDKCNILQLIPATYTDINKFVDTFVTMKTISDSDNNLLIMLDISMTPDNMEKVYKAWKDKFIWCDHHKPIILTSHQKPFTFGNCQGYHDRTDQSALIATYKYFNNMKDDGNIYELPYLLQALGVYDSWTHKLRGFDFNTINHINYAITYVTQLNVDYVLQDLDFFMSPYCDEDEEYARHLVEYGKSIEKMKIADVCNILKNNADFSWKVGDEKRHAVAFISNAKYNTAIYKKALTQVLGDLNSPIGHVNGKNIIVFSNDINTPNKWTMSLYNVDDTDKFDCGAYLKDKYNGGGHVGAAGCVLTSNKVKNMMKNRAI